MHRITELLEQTSRTFAVGIRQLPGPLRRSVSIAYLLLRVSDYFEDNEGMASEDKVGYLEAWAAAITAEGLDEAGFAGPAELDDRTPDHRAAREAQLILDAFRALDAPDRAVIGRHVADSTLGMARWVRTGPRFETEEDLDDYMFEVAGRVGLLLTDLFALRYAAVERRAEEMRRLGVEFGLGLQTVNVIRGMSSDPARGWIFLPRAFLPEDLAPETLWSDPAGGPALDLLDRLGAKATRHLASARDYVLGIPRRAHGVRVFCLLPLLFAVRTVERSRSNPLVFTREVKLTRSEVRSIARRTRLLAGSNAWVRSAVAVRAS